MHDDDDDENRDHVCRSEEKEIYVYGDNKKNHIGIYVFPRVDTYGPFYGDGSISVRLGSSRLGQFDGRILGTFFCGLRLSHAAWISEKDKSEDYSET